MALPGQAIFLIVGAGPSGLACALSLIGQGCQDIVVVDALSQGENTSRAMVIHAATLEALDTVDCADQLIQCGTKVERAAISDRFSPILKADFSYLVPYTRYPFTLLIPQHVTEYVLGEQVKSLGVRVFRPFRVVGIKNSEHEENILDVLFESGESMHVNYVVGADGAKSTVRQLAGIGFADPDGSNDDSQMILADIMFSPLPNPPISKDQIAATVTPHGISLILPLPPSVSSGYQNQEPLSESAVYRIFCSVPPSLGVPPHAPPTAYFQSLLDQFGPVTLSSDPSVNPHPVHISSTLWSARFRTHSAIAERFFVRFGNKQSTPNADKETGGVIFLIGDAAHIHSPAGGQGMNLGLRDAIGLGPVLASHLQQSQTSPPANDDRVLREHASARYARAMSIIHLTKRILSTAQATSSSSSVAYWLMRLFGKISWVRNMMVWRLSGLGTR